MWWWGKKQKILAVKDTLVGVTTYCPAPFFFFFALDFAFLQIK